ncbi:MAG: FAD-dependent oxidoreductase, partial [Gammaproteobacteria bacterium]
MPQTPEQLEYDALVIGSGAAGLTVALRLAPSLRVAVLSKGELTEGNTYYAQGGISAVLDDSDSFDLHVKDTLNAGAGLCNPEVVKYTVERGPAAVDWLIDSGVHFSRFTKPKTGEEVYHLTQEGGHSHRRVVHKADHTGKAIETTLVDVLKAKENIHVLEHHIAIDLITSTKLGHEGEPRVLGAWVLDRASGDVRTIKSNFVILATGGAAKAYLYTSNPDIATGDGIAMAWRAGCRVGNMEFIQFHPTCLFHPQAKSFLVSEAVRGEGGKLLLPNGERFMD